MKANYFTLYLSTHIYRSYSYNYMKHTLLTIAALACSVLMSNAERIHIYRKDGKHNVYRILQTDTLCKSQLDTIRLQSDSMNMTFNNGARYAVNIGSIDSLIFNDESKVARMDIKFTNATDTVSRDVAIGCSIALNGKGMFSNYSGTGTIRGRGNSTWLWYPKKPYKLSLSKGAALMGMSSSKKWTLLANYRDPTFMMNAFALELGDYLGMKFTNHNRFVELYVNDTCKGLYQITEQIKQGKHAVDVSDDKGVLIALDVDDGPANSPNATDNFWSSVYELPVCVKYPDDELLTTAKKDSVKKVFAELEKLVQAHNYAAVSKRLDLNSLINFLIVQEFTYNVELEAPRSMYMYTDSNSVWHFGPLWDFDAGFDFDWSNMYTGHDYFAEQKTLLGSSPFNTQTGVSQFFTAMFQNEQFVAQFKAHWDSVKTKLLPMIFTKLDNYKLQIEEAKLNDSELWPIGKNFDTEYQRLQNWLTARLSVMDANIQKYSATSSGGRGN